MTAAIFFDFRPVAGARRRAAPGRGRGPPERSAVVPALPREGRARVPPSGGAPPAAARGASAVDLKAQGLAPVVAPRAVLRIRGGGRRPRRRSSGSRRRGRAGDVAEGVFARVAEAYRFLPGLRLRLQLRSSSRGDPPRARWALAELERDRAERGSRRRSARSAGAVAGAGRLSLPDGLLAGRAVLLGTGACRPAPPAEPSGPHPGCAGPVTSRARLRGLARGPRGEGLRPSPAARGPLPAAPAPRDQSRVRERRRAV